MNRFALSVLLMVSSSAVALAECPGAASGTESPEQKVHEMVENGAQVRSSDGGTVTVPSSGMALPNENWFTPEEHSEIAEGGDAEVARAQSDAQKKAASGEAEQQGAKNAECG